MLTKLVSFTLLSAVLLLKFEQLLTNIKALIEQLNKIKPASTKGVYIRKVAVSSTMGPGVKVDVQTLN